MAKNGVLNLNGFENFIDDAMGQIEEDAYQVVLKIGIDLWRGIVLKTPVDTGRARASWNMSWDTPDGSVPPDGSYDDMPSLPNPGVTMTGETLHVSSNLHYIEYLEEGKPGPGSDQAPQGMVKVTLEEIKNHLS